MTGKFDGGTIPFNGLRSLGGSVRFFSHSRAISWMAPVPHKQGAQEAGGLRLVAYGCVTVSRLAARQLHQGCGR